MSVKDNSYSKYLTENDNFFYDEKTAKKSSLSKQDSELFNEEDYVPGKSVRVKVSDDGWQVLIDGDEFLMLRSSRFSAKERKFLETPDGLKFVIAGINSGWNSVSEFKRQIRVPK